MTESDAPFLPKMCWEPKTIFMMDRKRIQKQFLTDLLLQAGASGDVEHHAQQLLLRSEGHLVMGQRAKACGIKRSFTGMMMMDMATCFDYPVYVKEGANGFRFRWTVDIFNPQNQDCCLRNYNPDLEYLALLVSNQDFGFFNIRGLPVNMRAELREKFSVLGDMIKSMYASSSASFVFGTSEAHLFIYCAAHAYQIRKPMAFEKYFWPWAIYPPAKRHCISYHREKHQVIQDRHHPCHPNQDMYLEELPDGALWVYTTENCPDSDDPWYADALGLKVITNMRLKQLPLVHSWDD